MHVLFDATIGGFITQTFGLQEGHYLEANGEIHSPEQRLSDVLENNSMNRLLASTGCSTPREFAAAEKDLQIQRHTTAIMATH
jgi:hypothetical protein